jgi:hypothetical protein
MQQGHSKTRQVTERLGALVLARDGMGLSTTLTHCPLYETVDVGVKVT